MRTKRVDLTLFVVMLALTIVGLAMVLAGCQDRQAPNEAALTLTGFGLMRQSQWTVSVTGAAGAGAGSAGDAAGGVEGHIYAVHLDYTAGVSSTTDVTLTGGSPSETIFAKADSATDAWYYPGAQLTGSNGAALSGAYEPIPVFGSLTAAVAQSSTGTLTVTVLWGQ